MGVARLAFFLVLGGLLHQLGQSSVGQPAPTGSRAATILRNRTAVERNAPLAAAIRERGFKCPVAVGLVTERRDPKGRKTETVYCWTSSDTFDPQYSIAPSSVTEMLVTRGTDETSLVSVKPVEEARGRPSRAGTRSNPSSR